MRYYTGREVADLANLPLSRIRRWARSGLLDATKDATGHWRYTFQDVAILRAAAKLLRAGISPRRVTATLEKLREQLPHGRPLSAVQLVISGRRVVVKDRLACWEPETGQGALDFDMRGPRQASTPRLPRRRAALETAEDIYRSALELELAGEGDAARRAYERVLRSDPELVGARINLGRLLHAAGKLREAELLYRAALKQAPDSIVAAFNLGVVLEDQDRDHDAVHAYRQALAMDDGFADAHYNLSRLLEARGDVRGALRHLSRFRNLARGR